MDEPAQVHSGTSCPQSDRLRERMLSWRLAFRANAAARLGVDRFSRRPDMRGC